MTSPLSERYRVHATYFVHKRKSCWVANVYVGMIEPFIYLHQNVIVSFVNHISSIAVHIYTTKV